MSDKITDMTCFELRDKIASKQISSVKATGEILDTIEKSEPKIGAFISVFKERALEDANKVDRKISQGQKIGILAGVPVAVKDNMCMTFGTTTCGSKILKNFFAPYDASVVTKLKAQDAVIIGKTNLDEFAMGSSTENSGLKKTYNPLDLSRVPGGSSGGSAAAVAAKMCFGALGSDTGGSIRQPASFCGIVGLKPTYGRVSRYGLVAYGSSLDQIGPMARTVKDAALLLEAIAGHDCADSTSVDEVMAPVCKYSEIVDKPVENLRIAIVPEFNSGAESDVADGVKKAIDAYRGMGAKIVEVDMPHLKYAIATYYVIATAEASSNLARYDGVHFGHRSTNAEDLIEVYTKSRAEGFGQEVKRRIMLGTYALSSGYYDAYYLKALKVRNLIRRDYTEVFEQADCLIMPVSPSTAFKVGEKTADPLQMYLSDIYTIGVNLAGVPGISIPCGFDKNSMPIGLQIIAPAFKEEKLLRIARMYEVNSGAHL